ncbi:MAG: 2-oxoglutarate dehydrogenase E1 component [Opitutales bacterium]|nr:2-oxoglutarate dehydrogenase E1 component [Opitutales bacterium]
MKNLTFANRWNADLIDDNYNKWKEGTDDLDPMWEAFFEGFELASKKDGASAVVPEKDTTAYKDYKVQARAIGAVFAYRSRGHTQATINPLQIELPINPRLALDRLGFQTSDLDTVIHTGNYLGGIDITVHELIDKLRNTYCGNIGIEYVHIQEARKRRWLQARIEPNNFSHEFCFDEQTRILQKIVEAEAFETYLHTSFVGQKRFSLEGGETLIAALDVIAQHCPKHTVEEIVMGMAHRGRLNVLANFVGKSKEMMLREFSKFHLPSDLDGDGDVKYHLGYDNTWRTEDGNEITIRLSANPSHLEAVDPVVEGRARARQRVLDDMDRKRVLPILIHGDAAIAGQGIVSEVLNFSQLKGYKTGGTIHFVVNNQIGFTTDPEDARSSYYCTDVAKMMEVPVFHVNGNDPLAVAHVSKIALEYRQEFQTDVFIDMVCYRRHGHNETDEPAFTQPNLYRKISNMPLVSEIYSHDLQKLGVIDEGGAEKLRQEYVQSLDEAKKITAEAQAEETEVTVATFEGSSAEFQPEYTFEDIETGIDAERLEHIARTLTVPPEDKNLNPKIVRLLKTKLKNFENGEGIDWAFAELLAWGGLLMDGVPVRISGQDVERGTFSQRHAVFKDMTTHEKYTPLMHLSDDQARFCVHNSLLSEAAVLGFDFGYSLEYPKMLCIWEAQFGDFANGAQVIIDQFITSSESKWGRVSGLVMLLPHGYEGQGPEHSSARLERYLQACAERNIQVCNITTPAQYFHVLRRQMMRSFRKPLIIMSPKSLLRHPEATSKVDSFINDHFRSILDDPNPGTEIDRVILCSGKIYYDIEKEKQTNSRNNAAIVRIEQFYPLNRDLLHEVVSAYGDVKIVYCQEESANMGAWSFLAPQLESIFKKKPYYCGRDASASPATGFSRIHQLEQEEIVQRAFEI